MADDHRLATSHLGRDLVRLLRGYPRWQDTDEGHGQFGLMLERVLRAALAAADIGTVSEREMDRARKAANRTLAEIVKMTPALETEDSVYQRTADLYAEWYGAQRSRPTREEVAAWWLAAVAEPRPPCASDMLGNLSRTGDKDAE